LLSRWNPSKGLPVFALLFQSGIALALVVFGAMQKDGFTAMVEFTAPVFWGFLCLVGLSLFILRRKTSARTDAFRVPLYPVTPLLFVASCGYLTYSSVQYAMSQQALTVSAWLMGVGVLVLLALRFGSGNTGATRPA
jgi:amino acid transporter